MSTTYGEEWHIEMTWNCSACRRQNLGRHKECVQCGKPKGADEPFIMPADPGNAVRVNDAMLLRMASAGPDWQCAYCQSMQRSLEGKCMRCGASPVNEPGRSPATAVMPPPAAAPFGQQPPPMAYGVAGGYRAPKYSAQDMVDMGIKPAWTLRTVAPWVVPPVALFVLFVLWVVWPRDFPATVTVSAWERVISVDRFALRPQEGFAETRPADALEVQSLGQRVHHHEQVFDHYETEHYTVRVPDGYRSETYTERESCGQDCTERPRNCRNVCSSSGNGFARCREVCSGGGQSCSTRYCDRTHTRQVQQYRDDPRTRQVSRYRSEPRYAEFFSWRAWTWAPDRTARIGGNTPATLRWPVEEAHVGANLGPGEQERETRSERYVLAISYRDGRDTAWYVPASQQEYVSYPLGRRLTVHTAGSAREVRDASTRQLLLQGPQLQYVRPSDAPTGM